MSAMGSGLGWRLRAISNLAQIVPFMADAGLHHLPVVDEDGRVVGMVTQSDVMAAMFAVATDDAKEKAPAAPLQIKSEAAAGR
ncbi:CBS domain-containing protein [Devosia sp.]|uniref:CBS domain-containing protein n=1 Tax=Devosia sp. TaxID=1871048 RepID=UPI002FC92D40